MKWFKSKKKSNEKVGLLFDHQGIELQEEDIVLFPERSAVFASVTPTHEMVFFPLCSVNMRILNPEWDFEAHFVYVYREPVEDVCLTKYYTTYCGDYSLGFDCLEGKYSLQAKTEMLELSPRYEKYQQKALEKYNRFVKEYQENGWSSVLPYRATPNFMIKRFGKTPMWIQKDATPKDLNGEALIFVGQVRVLDFIGEEQYLYLFYSPKFHYFVQREQYL